MHDFWKFFTWRKPNISVQFKGKGKYENKYLWRDCAACSPNWKEVFSRLLNPKLITWTNASLFAVLFLQGEINSWARRLACY